MDPRPRESEALGCSFSAGAQGAKSLPTKNILHIFPGGPAGHQVAPGFSLTLCHPDPAQHLSLPAGPWASWQDSTGLSPDKRVRNRLQHVPEVCIKGVAIGLSVLIHSQTRVYFISHCMGHSLGTGNKTVNKKIKLSTSLNYKGRGWR